MKMYEETNETFPDNEWGWEDEDEEGTEDDDSQEYDEWDDHGFRDETDYWTWKGY